MSKYRVVYERDESGMWIAHVAGRKGAHTYGRTIEQARERTREMLRLWVRDARNVELIDDVRLPIRLRRSVNRARLARRRADQIQAQAQMTAMAAARKLTGDLQLSLRDAGEVLGLSRQRVQQLVSRRRARRSA